MAKTCKSINCDNPVFSNLFCKYHQNERLDSKWIASLNKGRVSPVSNDNNNKVQTSAHQIRPLKKSYIKPKKREATGELVLFLKLYLERKGVCEITGEQIPFNVSSFAHILSKGAYPSLRLMGANLVMVKTEIHDLYDNSSKEKLLEKYPRAIIIYEKKDELRYNYYNS